MPSPVQQQNRTPAESPAESERFAAIAEDSRVKLLGERLKHYDSLIGDAKMRAQGIRTNADTLEKDLNENNGVTSYLSGYTAAIEKELKNTHAFFNKQQSHVELLSEQREKAQAQLASAIAFESDGRKAELRGDLKQAQELYNQAQHSFEASAAELQSNSDVDYNAVSKHKFDLSSVNLNYQKSKANIKTAETVTRAVRDGAVAAGATVATGGLSTAGYGFAAAVAGGASAGTAIGALSNTTEAIGHIAHGNKKTEKAFSDAGSQTLRDAKTSLITALSAGAGRLAAQGLGGRLGAAADKFHWRAAMGATGGATGAVVSTTINTTDRYVQAHSEFNSKYGACSPEERAARWEEFKNAQGLSAQQLARNSLMDIAVGLIGGSIGGAGGAYKSGAGAGLARYAAGTAVEGAADIALGVNAAALRARLDERELSFDDMCNEVVRSVLSTAAGEFAAGTGTKALPPGLKRSLRGSWTHGADAKDCASRVAAERGVLVKPEVVFVRGFKDEAAYCWKTNRILVNDKISASRLRAVVGHEMEHALQMQAIAYAASVCPDKLPPSFLRKHDGKQVVMMESRVIAATKKAYGDNQMLAEWGVKFANSMQQAAVAREQGQIANYRQSLTERLAYLAELSAINREVHAAGSELVGAAHKSAQGSSEQAAQRAKVHEYGQNAKLIKTEMEEVHRNIRREIAAGKKQIAGSVLPNHMLAYAVNPETENQLLQRIKSDAENSDARAVYADYLMENGDAAQYAQGLLIAAYCALEGCAADNHIRRAALQEQVNTIRTQALEAFRAQYHGEMSFNRGFAEQMTMTADNFIEHGAKFFYAERIRPTALRIEEQNLTDILPNLLNSPHMAFVRVLDLEGNAHYNSRLGAEGARHIAASANLRNLTSLNLGDNNFGTEGARHIAASANLRNLTSLDLGYNQLYTEGVRHIAASENLRNLTSLGLSHNYFGDEGAQHIAASANLRNLTSLELSRNRLGTEGARHIAASENLQNLTSLGLNYNNLGAEGARHIAASENLQNLTALNLFHNSLGAEDARHIATSENMRNLTALDLGYNTIGDEGAQHIAASANLRNLTALNLFHNSLRAEGARHIATSENMRNLTALNLGSNQISAEGARHIANSVNLRNLTSLNLTWNDIGAKGARLIRESPHLRNLRTFYN